MGTAANAARLDMATTAMPAGSVASAASTTPAATVPHGKGGTGQRDRRAEHYRRQTQAPTLDSHDSLSFTAFGPSPLAAQLEKIAPNTSQRTSTRPVYHLHGPTAQDIQAQSEVVRLINS
jgi:hypothetical protein